MNEAQQLADRCVSAWNETDPAHAVIRGQAIVRTAWRAFALWRERRDARIALRGMTARELADIGLTACDRAIVLSRRRRDNPDLGRNIRSFVHGRAG